MLLLPPTTFIVIIFNTYPSFLLIQRHGHLTWLRFFHTFPIDLQGAFLKEGNKFLNISLLTTKSLQATTLQNLREQAVLMHKTLADAWRRIKTLISSHLHPR